MGKIIVLGGGSSSEREVSIKSSEAVQNALNQTGFMAVFIDPSESSNYLNAKEDDIIFPILHGEFGEDGELQTLLEKNRIAFLGSSSSSSRKSFDKQLTRNILSNESISVPKGEVISTEQYSSHPLSQRPHVVKVLKGGSSIGTLIQRNSGLLDEKILRQTFSQQNFLIEELIEGTEITIPILDKEALPVIEIVPPTDGEFDYENKYNGKTKELCPPQSLDKKTQIKAQNIAEKVHSVMGCRHLSRVDIMIDSRDKLYVLEINTMPGMTEQSLYPLAAKTAGISMPELMKRFVELVKRDYSLD